MSKIFFALVCAVFFLACSPSGEDVLLDELYAELDKEVLEKQVTCDWALRSLISKCQDADKCAESATRITQIHTIRTNFFAFADKLISAHFYNNDFEQHKHSTDYPAEEIASTYLASVDSIQRLLPDGIVFSAPPDPGNQRASRSIFLFVTRMKYDLVGLEWRTIQMHNQTFPFGQIIQDNHEPVTAKEYPDPASRYAVSLHNNFMQQKFRQEVIVDEFSKDDVAFSRTPTVKLLDIVGVVEIDGLSTGRYKAVGWIGGQRFEHIGKVK